MRDRLEAFSPVSYRLVVCDLCARPPWLQWGTELPVKPEVRRGWGWYDCMFHDEHIPDAPCNCPDGRVRHGSHQIIEGEVQ